MQKDAQYKRRLLLGIIGMLIFIFLSIGAMGLYAYKTIMPLYREGQTHKKNMTEFSRQMALVAKYDREKKYQEELEAGKKALGYATSDIAKSQAYYAIGSAYYYLDEKELAKENANKSIKLDPKYSYAYDTLVQIDLDNKDYKSALENSKKFLKVQPDLGKTYQNLAYSYFYLGDKENAVKNIDKAIKLDPKSDIYKQDKTSFQQDNAKTTSVTSAADINPEDKDPNYWKTQLGYMSDDEKNINTITGNPKYDQAKLAQAKNMLNQRKSIINPIYSKLLAGQALNNADAQALDRYWAITAQYYVLADEILHPK